MTNKQFALIVFAIGFGLISCVCALMFMTIAKDLAQKVDYLERTCDINVRGERL